MGLRLKILFGFLILVVMLIIAGIWSIYELRIVGSSVQKLLDDNYKSINAAKRMIMALEREDSAVLLLLSGKWKEGRSILESGDKEFIQGLKRARDNVTIPGEKAFVDKIEMRYNEYKNLWIRPIVGTRHERNLEWYFKDVHSVFLEVKDGVEDLMTLNDQTMYKMASELKNRAHRAVMPGIVAILSAMIFVIIFNYFINYYLVGPIVKMTKGIRRFLDMREPFRVKVETRDELFNMANSIRELLEQVKRNEEES